MVWTKAGARRLLTALGIGFGSVLAVFGADKAEAAPNCKYQYKMTEDKTMPPGIGKEYAEYASRKILMKYDDCGQRVYTDWNGRVLDSGKKISDPAKKVAQQKSHGTKQAASTPRTEKGKRGGVVIDAHTGKAMVVVARGNNAVPDGYAVPEVREILPTPQSEKPSGYLGKFIDWIKNGPRSSANVIYPLTAQHLKPGFHPDQNNPGAISVVTKSFHEKHQDREGFWNNGWYAELAGGMADNSYFSCRGSKQTKSGRLIPVGCNVDKNYPDTSYIWAGIGKKLGEIQITDNTKVTFRGGYNIGLASYKDWQLTKVPRVLGQVPFAAIETCADIYNSNFVGGKISLCAQGTPHPKKGGIGGVFTLLATEVRVNMPVDFNGWVMGSTSLTDKPASSKEPFEIAAKGKKAKAKVAKPKRVMSEKLLQRHAAKVVASVR